MIHFFRDILNGPLYIVTTIISIIFIMAIIGYIMEKRKLEKKAKSQVTQINTENVVPIPEVKIKETVTQPVNKEPQPVINLEPAKPVQMTTVQESQPVINLEPAKPVQMTTVQEQLDTKPPVISIDNNMVTSNTTKPGFIVFTDPDEKQ